MTEQVDTTIDYSSKISNHSSYVYRTGQVLSSNSVTLSATSTTGITQILLPSQVQNLARSYLQFNVSSTAVAAKYKILSGDLLRMFDRIVLTDISTNSVLMDLTNIPYVYETIQRPGTYFNDLQSNYITGSTKIPTTVASGNLNPLTSSSKTNVILGATPPNIVYGTVTSDVSYTAQTRYYASANTNTAVNYSVRIKLEDFLFTILAVDKNIYTPSTLQMDIYWSPSNAFLYDCSAVDDLSTIGAVGGTTTISNISLNICCENNLSLISQTIDKVMNTGINFAFPYISNVKQSVGSTASPSYQINLNKSYGNTLLFAITSIFGNEGDNSVAGAYLSIANGAVDSGSTLTSYNTFLNGISILRQSGFDVTKSEDFQYNQVYSDKSAIQSRADYAYAWFHCDSFKRQAPLWSYKNEYTSVDGMSLEVPSTYQFMGTLGASRNNIYFTVLCGLKNIAFTNMGTVVSV